MKIKLNNFESEIFITRKRTNKNTYIRIKEDLNIYVTTNYFTSDKNIFCLIQDNKSSVLKMLEKQLKKNQKEAIFTYLGKKYSLVYTNLKTVTILEDKLLIDKEIDLNKWLLKQAQIIFQDQLYKMYQIFPLKIPYPSLTIRKMKTRWGVCNIKAKKITLNLELIKKDLKYLDYVIIHELSHLIYPNHQKEFWLLVSQTIPNYKELRKELNSYE